MIDLHKNEVIYEKNVSIFVAYDRLRRGSRIVNRHHHATTTASASGLWRRHVREPSGSRSVDSLRSRD